MLTLPQSQIPLENTQIIDNIRVDETDYSCIFFAYEQEMLGHFCIYSSTPSGARPILYSVFVYGDLGCTIEDARGRQVIDGHIEEKIGRIIQAYCNQLAQKSKESL